MIMYSNMTKSNLRYKIAHSSLNYLSLRKTFMAISIRKDRESKSIWVAWIADKGCPRERKRGLPNDALPLFYICEGRIQVRTQNLILISNIY